jgi:2-polyprenyl-3-methyl-5-hydroxy-6-metoxy-1,4-benzoquinol methylase
MAIPMTTHREITNEVVHRSPCLLCGGERFSEVFKDVIINNHSLSECLSCGMVQALPLSAVSSFDYSDYGDYLLLSNRDIDKRIRWATRHMTPVFRTIEKRFKDPVVADFGSGAGYFCKAAQDYGFKAIGVELSDKLTEFSKTRVGFGNIVKRIEDLNCKCDAIFMSDVIEHLHHAQSRQVMTEIVNHLNPTGLLVGNTPNFRSANIRLFKDKDPVIAPPSHVCYFSTMSLDSYLVSLGLTKVALYSRGLSSNSFFRKSKFERSFVEKGLRQAKLYELPVLVAVRVAFAAASIALQPFRMGYQIYFVYQKPSKHRTPSQEPRQGSFH